MEAAAPPKESTIPPSAAEVVIVGAGPAGTAMAIALRRRGVPVLLLDRAIFPRDKVCGDVLLPEAQHALRSLGLDTRPLEECSYACPGVRYVPASDREIAGEFRNRAGALQPWWMIRRLDLDAWLLDEARRAGVTTVEGASVEGVLRDEDGTVTGVRGRSAEGAGWRVAARVVAGADGAASIVAREVGVFARFPEHTCIAARAYLEDIELPEPFLEVFTTPSTLPGCAWIAPVGPRSANVGIGIVLSTANRLESTPQALFEEVRRTSPLLASRLQGRGKLTLRGWTLPAATERRRMAGAGWVLVGDAAGLVDPFTGHGIHNAITSGILAAEVIADGLVSGSGALELQHYEQRCRAALSGEVDRGAVLQRIHANPVVMRAITTACGWHPGLRSIFTALVGHSEPRHQLLSARSLARATVRVAQPPLAA